MRFSHTCTGEMASRLLVLGARPFGITPGGGCRALFITLLQLATMVRMVSDNSCETLLRIKKTKQQQIIEWAWNNENDTTQEERPGS